MKKSLKVVLAILVYCIPCLLSTNVIAQQDPANLLQNNQVGVWNIFDIELKGPQNGNPFLDVNLVASFTHGDSTITANGFYDGDGTYRIRFMPPEHGSWSYVTSSNSDVLDGISGRFTVKESTAGNHGPVCVVDQYHFAYADGKKFFPVGTTLYCWQIERYNETLKTLERSDINKVRFMPFPHSGNKFPPHNPWEGSVNNWDFDRPNLEFWRFMEEAVKDLGERGIQADFIFFHPYESGGRQTWGLGPELMTATQRENYLKYAVARLSAYSNVWWSMANEFDLINKSNDYWGDLANVVADADPYQHMHSIHGLPGTKYKWSQPWVTHVSYQISKNATELQNLQEFRTEYKKPILLDEYGYEGNAGAYWGKLTGEEELYRHWTATIQGIYATHGESWGPENFFWKGGTPQRHSFARVSWLSNELLNNENKPLPLGLEALDSTSAHVGEDYYLYYYGNCVTKEKTYNLPEEKEYRVDVLDTWNMTVTEMDGTYSGTFTISWPSGNYIAVRIYNVDIK